MSNKKNIHSVDFKVMASGHGCVNFNGNARLYSPEAGKYVENIKLPKILGEREYKTVNSILSNENAKVYVSTNCLRHAIFKEGFPTHISSLEVDHCFDLLKNPNGLVRGYAVTETNPLQRKSALYTEKAVDNARNFTAEILTTSGERNNTSLRTEINVGDTSYTFSCSINAEELQFISTDNIFGRASILATGDQLKQLTKDIAASLKKVSEELGLENDPSAQYGFWARKGRAIKEGEWGILLNQDAIHTLVQWTLDKIQNLEIRQAKGFMTVDSVNVDYNSGKSFRLKNDSLAAVSEKPDNLLYEIYYEEIKQTHRQLTMEETIKQAKEKAKKGKKVKLQIEDEE